MKRLSPKLRGAAWFIVPELVLAAQPHRRACIVERDDDRFVRAACWFLISISVGSEPRRFLGLMSQTVRLYNGQRPMQALNIAQQLAQCWDRQQSRPIEEECVARLFLRVKGFTRLHTTVLVIAVYNWLAWNP